MAQKSFKELFEGNEGAVAHKWSCYLDVYDRYLERFRGKEVVLYEVGVNYGGTLRLWRDFLGPKAKLVGFDINPACKAVEFEGASIEIGDQGSDEFWAEVLAKHPAPDIIIDDGSHMPFHQIKTMEILWPALNENGVFICEDTHTNYLKDFGAGFRHQTSFIEYAKGLVDEIHGWWSDNKEELYPTYLTRTCSAIAFHDSMVILEKKRRSEPYDIITGRDKDQFDKIGQDANGLVSMYRPSIAEKDMPAPESYPPMGDTIRKHKAKGPAAAGNAGLHEGAAQFTGHDEEVAKRLDDLLARVCYLERITAP